jgi:hypothetical protein
MVLEHGFSSSILRTFVCFVYGSQKIGDAYVQRDSALYPHFGCTHGSGDWFHANEFK